MSLLLCVLIVAAISTNESTFVGVWVWLRVSRRNLRSFVRSALCLEYRLAPLLSRAYTRALAIRACLSRTLEGRSLSIPQTNQPTRASCWYVGSLLRLSRALTHARTHWHSPTYARTRTRTCKQRYTMDIQANAASTRETLQRFETTLGEIQQPGLFACSGILNTGLPGITIPSLGPLGLPLCEVQARQLIGICTRSTSSSTTDNAASAPWELPPAQVLFSNPKWSETIAVVVGQAKHGLGVSEHVGIEARLHKLLLYENGCHSPMQVTEKQEGTFATLLIQLPSIYQGGHLIVCHKVCCSISICLSA